MPMTIRSILLSAAVALISLTTPALASDAPLPLRDGPRPVTTDGVPHVQLNVDVVPHLADELLRRVDALPGVEVRNSVISLPGARGFWLTEDQSIARPEVIVGGREFAHMHPDGSLHASLDPDLAVVAIERGWAIAHPWAKQRAGWEGFVMIYTPLTADELDVVTELVIGSYEFVTGGKVTR